MLIACLLLQTHTKYSSNQGGQLPDVSLRSLYLLYCRLPYDFVLYMPKTTTFSHSIAKQPAWTLEFQYFYSILQMNFCEPRQKTGRAPFLRWHLLRLDRPMTCGNAYVKHFTKFPNFFETQCWQPGWQPKYLSSVPTTPKAKIYCSADYKRPMTHSTNLCKERGYTCSRAT